MRSVVSEGKNDGAVDAGGSLVGLLDEEDDEPVAVGFEDVGGVGVSPGEVFVGAGVALCGGFVGSGWEGSGVAGSSVSDGVGSGGVGSGVIGGTVSVHSPVSDFSSDSSTLTVLPESGR